MSATNESLPVLSFGSVPPIKDASLPPFGSVVDGGAAVDDFEVRPPVNMQHLAQTVMKAKRIAVVCGAGISCASGIPDFRSSEGLFESLKRQHPKAKISSGKDLFDSSLFQNENNTAIFYSMIAELKTMADLAQPTKFHNFLKQLDDAGKLFRVYTQNIDCLEARAGLTYGLGDTSAPVRRRASVSPKKRTTRSSSGGQDDYPTPASSYQGSPPPPPAIPRVIPLHGHLATLSCAKCSNVVDLDSDYTQILADGGPPECPTCVEVNSARESAGERLRGVGLLKPDVVLYGEPHPDGDRVGEITRRDLMGARPDLVIVVGTSLKVPGTKRLVRELAKVAHPAVRMGGANAAEDMFPSASQDSMASTSSSRARRLKPAPVHVVYLNYDFPSPAREWQGVFDVWARGDAQEFVEAVEAEREAERERVEKRAQEKERLALRRVEREEAARKKEAQQPKLSFTATKKNIVQVKPKATPAPPASKKRKAEPEPGPTAAAKKSRPAAGPKKHSFTLEVKVSKAALTGRRK